MKRSAFLLLLASPFLVSAAESPSHRGTGLAVELVTETDRMVPGRTFPVGLLIRHDRGYHTYWQNPGLAGVATGLAWSLPPGFKAGPIQWPTPEKVKMASINTHGFEKDTLLITDITVPADCPPGPVTLRVKASWMCCARSCAPGYADLALTIPTGKEEPSASPHADAFRKARQQHPVPARDWQFTARRSQPNTIVLTARPTKPGAALPKNPQFFSADNLICSHPPQPWQKRDGTYEVALTLSEMPPKDQRSLRGVLTASQGWLGKGSARAITIDIPISP